MLYFSQLLPNEELSALVKKYSAGIELIDFSVGMNLDHLETYLKKWEQALIDMKEPPITLHGPFLDLNPMSFERLTAEASWYRFSQAYEAAKYLDAKRIIFHTCRIPTVCYLEGWADRLADFWNRFLEKHPDIPVSVENVFDEDPYAIADFASKVKAENFSLCFDVGHANHASKESAIKWLEVLCPWVEHLHLHDNHGIRDEHLALGKGNIDFEGVFRVVKDIPGMQSVTIENTGFEDCWESAEVLGKWGIK